MDNTKLSSTIHQEKVEMLMIIKSKFIGMVLKFMKSLEMVNKDHINGNYVNSQLMLKPVKILLNLEELAKMIIHMVVILIKLKCSN